MNSIVLSGRLTTEPRFSEVKDCPPGKWIRFGTAGLAVDMGKDAEGQQKTLFFDLAFRVYSEKFAQMLKKGDKVLVIGSMSYRDREKDGRKYRNWGVNVDRLELCLPPLEKKPSEAGTAADEDLPF